jgi:predicted nucleotidyltransferase
MVEPLREKPGATAMLGTETLEFIKDCARQYDAGSVWLFGSALVDEASARDIDLAVEGLDAGRFDDFYGRLFFGLPKPVDLVDLSEDPPIASLIRQRGTLIYERGS